MFGSQKLGEFLEFKTNLEQILGEPQIIKFHLLDKYAKKKMIKLNNNKDNNDDNIDHQVYHDKNIITA